MDIVRKIKLERWDLNRITNIQLGELMLNKVNHIRKIPDTRAESDMIN